MSNNEIPVGLRRVLDLPVGERPAPDVRAAVLRAVRATPPAERGGPPVGLAVAPYRAEASKLRRLLAGFSDRRQWHTPLPAADGWTVLELVAHLAAVDAVLLSGVAPGVRPADHGLDPDELLERTVALQRAQRLRPPRETLRLWWGQVETIADQVAAAGPALLDRPVAFAGGPVPVRDLLVDRAFETWIHADDVRDGEGLDPVRPAADHLAVMVELGVRVLRHVAAAAAVPAGTEGGLVSLDLTGDGRTWDVTVGGVRAVEPAAEPALEPAATITVDVIEFCRLLAARQTVDGLPATIRGDARLARAVLAAASTIARP